MRVEAFFDTNVLIYAVALDDPRNARAEELLASGGTISVQILNEFVSVARRKILMSWREREGSARCLSRSLSFPAPHHDGNARGSAQDCGTGGYGIYDALVVAAALEAECATLYSEDFQDGQTIDGRLTIRNPFAQPSGGVSARTIAFFARGPYRSSIPEYPNKRTTTGRKHGTPKIGKEWTAGFRTWTWMHGNVLCLWTDG